MALVTTLGELDFLRRDYASMQHQRDLLLQRVEVLEELLKLKADVIAAMDERDRARLQQIEGQEKMLAGFQARLDKVEAKLERAEQWGDLKAIAVGIIALLAAFL